MADSEENICDEKKTLVLAQGQPMHPTQSQHVGYSGKLRIETLEEQQKQQSQNGNGADRDASDTPTTQTSHVSHGTMKDLTTAIEALSKKLDTFMDFTKNSIPIKSVYLIFTLVFALIFGIEAVQFFFKLWLPKVIGG